MAESDSFHSSRVAEEQIALPLARSLTAMLTSAVS